MQLPKAKQKTQTTYGPMTHDDMNPVLSRNTPHKYSKPVSKQDTLLPLHRHNL